MSPQEQPFNPAAISDQHHVVLLALNGQPRTERGVVLLLDESGYPIADLDIETILRELVEGGYVAVLGIEVGDQPGHRYRITWEGKQWLHARRRWEQALDGNLDERPPPEAERV